MFVKKKEMIVRIADGEIFTTLWEVAGATQPPVVLLHDSLGAVATWRDFPEKLATTLGRTVVAYDRLGFGRSSARKELPSIHFIREEAEIHLPEVLKGLGITECVLMGHSVGGGMALTAASVLPQVKAVISMSAQAFVEDRTRKGIEDSKKAFASSERIERLEKYHGSKARWVVDAWTEVWLSPEFADWSLRDILPNVQCPVLVIHGDQDEYGSVRFPEMICELVQGPFTKKILVGGGHVPHKENENQVLELVREFLQF